MPCSIEDLVNSVAVQWVIGQLCLVQSYSCSIASCSMISLFNSFVQFSMFNLELFNWPERVLSVCGQPRLPKTAQIHMVMECMVRDMFSWQHIAQSNYPFNIVYGQTRRSSVLFHILQTATWQINKGACNTDWFGRILSWSQERFRRDLQ